MKTARTVAAWILLGALALALPAAAQQQQQQPPPPAQQPQQGQQPSFTLGQTQPGPEETEAVTQILQTADLDQRLALIQDFLAKYPNSMLVGRAYAAAADAYRKKNKHAQTIEYGEKAIELSPKDAYSMILVADSLAESAVPTQPDYQEKLSKSENYCRSSLEILPEMFAAIPRRPGVPEEQYAAAQHQSEGLAHAILGFVHLRRGENAQAVEELNKAVQTDSFKPQPLDYHRLGLAYKRQGQLKEAESAFQHCVEISGGGFLDCQKQLDQVRQTLGSSTATPEKKP